MSDPISRDDLLALRAEYDRKLGALQAEVTTLRRRARRRGHPLLLILPIVLLAAIVPFSLVAAAPVFSDIGTAATVHRSDIQAIGDAGITTGFEDPGNPGARLYNPTDLVTRQEMASFLARTAGLGTNAPTARAARLGVTSPSAGSPSYAANELVRTAQATNANEFAVTRVLNVDQAFDPIATVGIVAPTAGFVIVSGTVGIAIEGTGTVGLVRLRDTNVGTASPTVHAATNRGPNALGAQATTLSRMYVFPVAAGQRSFILEAQRSGPGSVLVSNGTVTAIFVPFGSGGAAGTGGEQP